MLNSTFRKAVSELEGHLYMIKQELNDEGYAYMPIPNAPSEFGALKRLVAAQEDQTIITIPVLSKYSDKTIFSDPKYNYVLRFWHDYCHLLLDLGYSYAEEEIVVSYQMDWLESRGASKLALAVLFYDLSGQCKYHEARGEFPVNQEAFVQSCIRNGIRTSCMAKF